MKKIKSDFIKNLNKIKRLREVDGDYISLGRLLFSRPSSSFLPRTKLECDTLLLLSSYPLSEQLGVFKVENSLLYMCKIKHPVLNELFEFMGFNKEDEQVFVELVCQHDVDYLEYFNLLRDDKCHDELVNFSQGYISEFCFSIAEKSQFGTVVSHPAKMTHPSCKKPRVLFKDGIKRSDGLLRSGNLNVDFDLHINATQLIVYKFLSLPYKGGCLLDCIEKNDVNAFSEVFLLSNKESDLLVSKFSSCLNYKEEQTGENIRQVYFPVSSGYHLLSILSPSGLVFELKNKIEWINNKSPESYLGRKCKREGKYYGGEYQQIINLTETKHGGDHPKNISGLNNKHQSYYLLPSLPPELAPRSVRLPTRNFFGDVLYPRQLQQTFEAFHRLLKADYNNLNIRNARDYRIQEYLDHVILKMWQVRNAFTEHPHSRPEKLIAYQKQWLFPEHQDERNLDVPWLDTLISDITRNFIASYERVMGNSAIKLADVELTAFSKIIEQNKEALL